MTLRQGLMYSKNTITAQVMQAVGPAHVARLAKAMGVRQSQLDEVLSLALGTSPVTLKEMVSAYSTLANDGRYIEPMLVTQVEDRNGKVLEAFQPKVAESAVSPAVAQTLLNVMRGVIDQGTGAAIRSRYGIRADVAGKTGTTQGNTDGWFILMQPQLVAGAWVGFNDNRITMGNSWGPGARSALPIVGEFFQQAIKIKAIDAKQRFNTPDLPNVIDPNIALNNGVPGNEALANTERAEGEATESGQGTERQEGELPPPPPGTVRYFTVPRSPDGTSSPGLRMPTGSRQEQLVGVPIAVDPVDGPQTQRLDPDGIGIGTRLPPFPWSEVRLPASGSR